ncbi:hypothetical protein [Oceanicella sp. SM1341]|uniref:hypothetical protein n=1 Tax=Oceanicella sp. SM1341 TaxID=1548889 RepID=UPI00130019F7|nr:hypothetical protein [Oceanicella sp. SM1341]
MNRKDTGPERDPARERGRDMPAQAGVEPLPYNPRDQRKNPAGSAVRFRGGEVAEGTERLKTLLEVAARIYSELGESKKVLFNTRAYACLRCLKSRA